MASPSRAGRPGFTTRPVGSGRSARRRTWSVSRSKRRGGPQPAPHSGSPTTPALLAVDRVAHGRVALVRGRNLRVELALKVRVDGPHRVRPVRLGDVSADLLVLAALDLV